eukprot:TRINITY_DN47885_c0_g1_i1.p1 TRINITY_DN47885_c0_g1~~TRINITY_DN47885_c0_g1_i1.p1  ORF type:complete len:457 (+),score=100.21 TRINITY_DN47885_c0_g1_i1:60-1373(+)
MDEPTGGEHRRWHENDWDGVLAGQGTADRYFARPGLVRKERLAQFVPPEYHPTTFAVSSFETLVSAASSLQRDLPSTGGTSDQTVAFVLKQAHSSNASGIRFLSFLDLAALSAAADTTAAAANGGSNSRGSEGASQEALLLPSALAAATCGGAVAVALASRRSGSSSGSTARSAGAAAGTAAAVAVLSGLALVSVTRAVNSALCASSAAASRRRSHAIVADLRRLLRPDAEGKRRTWVLQRFVSPWLHEGRKFHLRILLLCVGDLEAYVHEDVRLLVATEPFARGREDGKNTLAHVTNMGANQQHPGYSATTQNLPLSVLGEEQAERILRHASEALGATLARLRAAGRRHFFTTANCWELFGTDFVVEAGSGRTLLLEVNPSPSLAMHGDGPGMRARLVGPDPLAEVPSGWRPVLLPEARAAAAASGLAGDGDGAGG